MRGEYLAGCVLALSLALAPSVQAQAPSAPAPPVAPTTGAQAPQHPTYADAPEILTPPPHWDSASLTAARGNLARWRNAERRRIGLAPPEGCTGGANDPMGCMRPFEGYFMVLPRPGTEAPPFMPGSIVSGRFFDPYSNIGTSDFLAATLVDGKGICGATINLLRVDDAVYLGPAYDASWPELRAAMALDIPDQVFSDPPHIDRALVQIATRPPAEASAAYYPGRALGNNISGVGVAACAILVDGALRCGGLSEDPAGWGFALATARLANAITVRENLTDGRSGVGSCFELRVPWNAG